MVDGRGVHPCHVGDLPPQLAALANANIASEEMAVQAAITGDSRLVFQAICYDPLTAAVLSLAEIKQMVRKCSKKTSLIYHNSTILKSDRPKCMSLN